ncbi:MAG: hypothetical protein ABL961_09630 [Vicinamibacterales bacterium]
MSLVSLLALALAQGQPPSPPVFPCSQVAIGYYSAGAELGMAESQIETADASKDSEDRQRRLDTAVEHYLMVGNLDGDEAVKACALDGLAEVYGPTRLNKPDKLEEVLGRRFVIKPEDLEPVYRLAALQEARGAADLAEQTLVAAETAHPTDAALKKRIADLRARRGK